MQFWPLSDKYIRFGVSANVPNWHWSDYLFSPTTCCKKNFITSVLKTPINGLVQDCSKSIANALDLLQSCTKQQIVSQAVLIIRSNTTCYHTSVRVKKAALLHLSYQCITMTSQWVGWRLKSPASRLFTQPFIRAEIKENIKAPCHWPLCGEFTGDRWIPRTNGQ